MKSVLTIGLSPAFERVMVFPSMKEGEVNRAEKSYLFASGKALNVTRVLASLNREAVNITHLSRERKDEFIQLAERENLRIKYVISSSPTRCCTTIINKEKKSSTELVEEAGDIGEGVTEKFYSLFLKEVKNHSAVIISGKKAKGFEDWIIPKIVEECSKRNIPTVLDIRGKDLRDSLIYRPAVIKPNFVEFASTFLDSQDLNEADDNERLIKRVKEKIEELYSLYGVKSVISRGKYPVLSYDGLALHETEIPKIDALNTVGCGDTLTAALTHFLLDGDTLEEAAGKAVQKASLKAQKETFII